MVNYTDRIRVLLRLVTLIVLVLITSQCLIYKISVYDWVQNTDSPLREREREGEREGV